MQKALTQMNVQLANVISDISGVTGMAIVRAMVKGERDRWVLAKMRDKRIRASEEEIAHSLEGNWREDVLFELKQVVAGYDFYRKQIVACDAELQVRLTVLSHRRAGEQTETEALGESNDGKKRPHKSPRKNQPRFDLRTELRRIFGVDLTTIDGIDVMVAQVILSELGPDLRAFPTEGHFSSWLELAPRKDISGGKVLRQKPRKSKNRVANALRMAAESLSHSDSYLGARYRRLRARMEGKEAVKAMARYLACLVHRLLTKGQDYVDRGAAYFEKKRSDREMVNLQRRANELGLKLVPVR